MIALRRESRGEDVLEESRRATTSSSSSPLHLNKSFALILKDTSRCKICKELILAKLSHAVKGDANKRKRFILDNFLANLAQMILLADAWLWHRKWMFSFYFRVGWGKTTTTS